MAPDVEMRLSFPKKTTALTPKHAKEAILNLPIHQTKSMKSIQQHSENSNNTQRMHAENHHHLHQPAILPPPSINLNPKRTLSRNHYLSGIRFKIH